MIRYPPAGLIQRLRRAVGEATLTIEWDEEAAERTKSEAWVVLYLEGPNKAPTWIADWPFPLDGAFDSILARVRRVSYGYVDQKSYARTIEAKMSRIREARKKRRLDTFGQVGGYMKRAFSAFIDGAPSVGNFGVGLRSRMPEEKPLAPPPAP
jgi:hypothetical protein